MNNRLCLSNLEGESITFHLDVPNGGKDIQNAPVHWILPRGKTVCKSMREVLKMDHSELVAGIGVEDYHEIAKVMNYWCIGVLEDDELNDFKANPGTLGGAKWKNMNAKKQGLQNDMAPCW